MESEVVNFPWLSAPVVLVSTLVDPSESLTVALRITRSPAGYPVPATVAPEPGRTADGDTVIDAGTCWMLRTAFDWPFGPVATTVNVPAAASPGIVRWV